MTLPVSLVSLAWITGWIAAGYHSGETKLVFQERISVSITTGSVLGLGFGPKDRFLAVVCSNGLIAQFDATTLEAIRTVRCDSHIATACFSPTGDCLAFCEGHPGPTVRIMRLTHRAPSPPLEELEGPGGRIVGLAYSNKGNYLVAVTDEGRVAIWDTVSWKIKASFLWPLGELRRPRQRMAVAFNEDAEVVFLGFNNVLAYDLKNQRSLPEIPFKNGLAFSLAVSRSGSFLAIGGQGHLVRLWDLRNQRAILEYDGGSWPKVALSHDERMLVCGSVSSAWILELGFPPRPPIPVLETTGPAAVSSDGRRLATCDRQGVLLWKVDRR